MVTTARAPASPCAVDVQHNHNAWGQDMGIGVAEFLDGPGDVLMV